jgi:protein O-GlcNAc transferase
MQPIQLLFQQAMTLHEAGRFSEALAHYDEILRQRPDFVEGQIPRAHVLWSLGRSPDAIAALDAVLAARPDNSEAFYNRGFMLQRLHRVAEALVDFERALVLRPDLVLAWNNRGIVLQKLGRHVEAIASYDQALARDPGLASAFYNRGLLRQILGDHDSARADFASALRCDPAHPHALGCLAVSAQQVCDFAAVAHLSETVIDHVRHGKSVIPPLAFLGYSQDKALQKLCSEHYLAATLPADLRPFAPRSLRARGKIRIAYLSSDFHNHATAFLAAQLFERHDRARFELIALSFGPTPPPDDRMRPRLVAAFDSFHEIAGKSDLEIAQMLRGMEVDIAVDLKGHTEGARPAILAYRPCPVQVQYLGFPGTMGGDFIDYVIGDAVVTPLQDADFYSEAIAALPHSYQVNDAARARPGPLPRTALGLPPDQFVFCSFNNSWKITATVFAVWMRLLAAVPGSVLWLLGDNDQTMRNLRGAATAQGIDPARLIFAPRVDIKIHLARQAAADLFLDTLPYNAHTTASEALWMGLPLLTCKGDSFAGRVAASLLQAVGLPELIAGTLEEYEVLALALAQDPARLQALRARLQNAPATSLFDSAAFTQHLESAYTRMWDRALAGEAARGFRIA